MLQQLLLGFAREAEGAVLWIREARAPRCRRQLLEIGFLDRAAAGIHSCGGISAGGERRHGPRLPGHTPDPTHRPREVLGSGPMMPTAGGAATVVQGSTCTLEFQAPRAIFPSLRLPGGWRHLWRERPWWPLPQSLRLRGSVDGVAGSRLSPRPAIRSRGARTWRRRAGRCRPAARH